MSGGTHTKTREAYDACLQDDEGEATLDCGCRLVRCDCCTAIYLTFCPLHAAVAEDELDERGITVCSKCGWRLPREEATT